MATLRIPVSEQAHQWVKARAKRNGRSMSAEAAAIIEEAVKRDWLVRERTEALRDLDELRRQTAFPPGAAESAALIREDRER